MFTNQLLKNPQVQAYFQAYLEHPFIVEMLEGNLSKERYKRYLIQDTHYLKDYSKVFANIYLLLDRVKDLQFLHRCMGVVMSEETNMHIQYLKDFNLDVYQIESLKIEKATREYLDYMLSFTKENNAAKLFCVALPCTLTYEYIGKSLKAKRLLQGNDNYYDPWIDAYAGQAFEKFALDSVDLMNRLTEKLSLTEKEELIEIFIKSCEYEMEFWNMSYGGKHA